ncbi:hypothetical protein SKAU_G00133020 [Synaphobranchus kaupii]|uniref:Uncharacterized protein n=1 Tax=Synaphobranchus kaupii TaxID=118154 RepID=A0A9Q1FRB3_SYNKA|nr:hypothetical protein SKAU_G00133020 [Synaphobranchus kaupii]
MAASLVQLFLEAPSVDVLDQCRKVDLCSIADHYEISVSRSWVKAEIKQVVLAGLVGQRVLGEGVAEPASSSPQPFPSSRTDDKVVGEPDADADVSDVKATPPATLPRFEPMSSLSTPSHSPSRSVTGANVRLKVRLARLQLEAQSKQAEADRECNLRLEIRKMELEAEVQIRRLEKEEKIALAHVQRPSNGVSSAPVSPTSLAPQTVRVFRFPLLCLLWVPTPRVPYTRKYPILALLRLLRVVRRPMVFVCLFVQRPIRGSSAFI